MEITLKNLQKKIPIPRARILKAAKAAFRKLEKREQFKVPPSFSLSIVFAGTKRMRAVNKKYLGHDYVTDVLTFEFGATRHNRNSSWNSGYVECPQLHEIIICPRVARTQAQAHQTSTENEIILYVIHGILHLAGFDDHRPKDILKMRRMEKELL